jgi:RHS repeat-associated protein
MAKANPLRFSTKFQDDETDLLYYGYRYYSRSTGRWSSRDPISEKGGLNNYGFVLNRPMTIHDPFGLDGIDILRASLLQGYGFMAGSTWAWTTRTPQALACGLYEFTLGHPFQVKLTTLSGSVAAQWEPWYNVMYLDNRAGNVDPMYALHETVHARNDLEYNLSTYERMDEGLAYTMQAYYQMARFLASNEGTVNRRPCDKGMVEGIWKNFWNSYGTMPASGWGTVTWGWLSPQTESLNWSTGVTVVGIKRP